MTGVLIRRGKVGHTHAHREDTMWVEDINWSDASISQGMANIPGSKVRLPEHIELGKCDIIIIINTTYIFYEWLFQTLRTQRWIRR